MTVKRELTLQCFVMKGKNPPDVCSGLVAHLSWDALCRHIHCITYDICGQSRAPLAAFFFCATITHECAIACHAEVYSWMNCGRSYCSISLHFYTTVSSFFCRRVGYCCEPANAIVLILSKWITWASVPDDTIANRPHEAIATTRTRHVYQSLARKKP